MPRQICISDVSGKSHTESKSSRNLVFLFTQTASSQPKCRQYKAMFVSQSCSLCLVLFHCSTNGILAECFSKQTSI